MSSELFIELRFPGGRYHTTPWDRQVNEGAVEWPPSPWRILRALIGVWHAKESENVSEAVVKTLVARLSELAPSWHLPKAVQAHTRHYMPTRDTTTKIFDNFLVIDRDTPAIAHWPGLVLEAELSTALDRLLAAFNYLGRSESWADLRRIEPPSDFLPNAGPTERIAPAQGQENVRQLMPLNAQRLVDWREGYREAMISRTLSAAQRKALKSGKDPDKIKLSKSDLENIEKSLPATPYDVLTCETDALQKAGWSQPPGTHWVDYLAPPIVAWLAPKSPARPNTSLATVARFAVASQVPPRLTTTIHQTHKLHQSLVKFSNNHALFTGFDANGARQQGHQHAYLFAEANDGRTDRITHLNVWIPGGITDDIQREALDRVQHLWGKDGHDLQLVLLGVGTPQDFAGHNTRAGQCPLMEESTTWRSLTPFVSTRHPKQRKNGEFKRDEQGLIIDGPERDLMRLLNEQGLPEIVAIEAFDQAEIAGRKLRWLEFDTQRTKGGGARGPSHGTGFQITFAEKVRGPIAAGYAAHFGMGLFTPIDPFANRSTP